MISRDLRSHTNFWDSVDIFSEESSIENLSDSITMSTSHAGKDSAKVTVQTSGPSGTGAVSNLRKNPPSACYKSTYVTIEVGPNKNVYIVHKDLLTFYSDLFRAAFNGSFKEATDGKMSLPDESKHVFDIFNKFIYARRITDEQDQKLSWNLLVRIWLFGDEYRIPSLQNSAMDEIVEKNRNEKIIPTLQISLIWEKTLPSSPLRKFILDHAVHSRNIAKFRLHEERWTREALFDLIEACANKEATEGGGCPPRAKCYFHIHKEGEEC